MRKTTIIVSVAMLAVAVVGATVLLKPSQELPTVTVYKSPTCGCCKNWVAHLEANGFTVKTEDMPDTTPMKARYGVPNNLRSCHTAVVAGYVVEGHVPADLVKKLIQEKPEVAGIAVPGMPVGSPGMEGPNPQAYDIISFTKGGEQSVYAGR